MTTIVLHGRKVVGGISEGEALVTRDTVSGWGGFDPRTGKVVETRHELCGVSLKDKILVFPGAKGSSGWSGFFQAARLMVENLEFDRLTVAVKRVARNAIHS